MKSQKYNSTFLNVTLPIFNTVFLTNLDNDAQNTI